MRSDSKRFRVWVAPGGYLTATPAGELPYMGRGWLPLVTVNRPISPRLVQAAYGPLVRAYGL